MNNYRTIRCNVEFYIPVDNVENNCMSEDDLEEFVLHDLETAINKQLQNGNSVLYQSSYIANVED